MFKVVVVASVTRNPDQKKIQDTIADMLHFKLDEKSEMGRAEHIRLRLKNETENILIVLDDLWDGLDLNGLGIPIGDDGFSDKMDNKGKDEGEAEELIAEKEKLPTRQGMIKDKRKGMPTKKDKPLDNQGMIKSKAEVTTTRKKRNDLLTREGLKFC